MICTITAHRDHLCNEHFTPVCHVAHVRFYMEWRSRTSGTWAALPAVVFCMNPVRRN